MNKLLKLPKGTFDHTPDLAYKRLLGINKIRKIFQLHGGQEIDTPVFELKSTLMNKYGDQEKLIYDLQDQGGELLSLRYDLTIPFTRYIATQGINKMKRYQFGKVYRRDNPSYKQGRFREFLQCDFDICGYKDQLADAEIIVILGQCMKELKGTNQFTIRINNKSIINGILEIVGVTQNQSLITSAIDKLDKIGWEGVEIELAQKGLALNQITQLKHIINTNPISHNNDSIKKGNEELMEITQLANSWGISEIRSDFTLMRGLDYYTGMILECDIGEGVSVAGGGRYDNLLAIPCVGMSIGLDRLLSYLPNQTKPQGISILSIGNSIELKQYMIQLQNKFNQYNINTHICLNPKLKLEKQIDWSLSEDRHIVCIVGDNEMKSQTFNLKNLNIKQQKTYSISAIEQVCQDISDQ